jgi:hypothetical protein
MVRSFAPAKRLLLQLILLRSNITLLLLFVVLKYLPLPLDTPFYRSYLIKGLISYLCDFQIRKQV